MLRYGITTAAVGRWGDCAGGVRFSGAAPGQTGTGSSSCGLGHVLQTDFSGSGFAGPNGENPVGTLTLSGYLNFTARFLLLGFARAH